MPTAVTSTYIRALRYLSLIKEYNMSWIHKYAYKYYLTAIIGATSFSSLSLTFNTRNIQTNYWSNNWLEEMFNF